MTATVAYTFSKSLTNAANSNTSYLTPNDPVLNDPFNIPTDKQLSGFDQPQVLVISFNYTTPKTEGLFGDKPLGKAASWLARDWTIGGVLKYASGQLIQSSPSNITLWNTMGIGGTPLNGVSNFGGIPNPLRTMFPASRAWPSIRTAISTRPKRWCSESERLVEPDHGDVWRRGALLQ